MSRWSTVRLGDILTIRNGFAFDSKKFGETGKPLIRIRNLKDGSGTETRFSGEYDPVYVVKPGDLLVGMDGEFRTHRWSGAEALLNQRVCRLENFRDDVSSEFIEYGLNRFLSDIEERTTFTTVKHISAKQILAIQFPLPPLDEQKRIVAKLDQIRREVGRLSDNVAKQMETVKSLRGAALADRLQGENVLQGNVAAGWPVVMLTDHVEVQPPNGKVKRSDFLARGTYPVVSQEVGSINGWWDGPVEVTPVDRPVVLFGDHTRILKYIDHDFVVGADGVKILRPRSSLDPRFLFHLLTANPPRHLGYARHFRLLKELKFRLPPLEDQKSIAAELDGLGVQFDEIESKLAEQETLLSSFQSAAFSTALAGGP